MPNYMYVSAYFALPSYMPLESGLIFISFDAFLLGSIQELLCLFSTILIFLGIGFLSILFVEIVRDSYHLIGHKNKAIQKLHHMHHKITKGKPDSFAELDVEQYQQSQWVNDLPEILVMFIASLILPAFCFLIIHFI